MLKKFAKVLTFSFLVFVLAMPFVSQAATKHHHHASSWVESVQQALKAKGNDPGPIDGHMGHKTEAAVKDFQKANGLKETGKVDKETADKLGIEMPTTHHMAHSTKAASTTKP